MKIKFIYLCFLYFRFDHSFGFFFTLLTLFFPIFLIQNFSGPAIPKRNLQIHTAIKIQSFKLSPSSHYILEK